MKCLLLHWKLQCAFLITNNDHGTHFEGFHYHIDQRIQIWIELQTWQEKNDPIPMEPTGTEE